MDNLSSGKDVLFYPPHRSAVPKCFPPVSIPIRKSVVSRGLLTHTRIVSSWVSYHRFQGCTKTPTINCRSSDISIPSELSDLPDGPKEVDVFHKTSVAFWMMKGIFRASLQRDAPTCFFVALQPPWVYSIYTWRFPEIGVPPNHPFGYFP